MASKATCVYGVKPTTKYSIAKKGIKNSEMSKVKAASVKSMKNKKY